MIYDIWGYFWDNDDGGPMQSILYYPIDFSIHVCVVIDKDIMRMLLHHFILSYY